MGSVERQPDGERGYPRNTREFAAWFRDEASCQAHLEGLRWPDGFECPHCGKPSPIFGSGGGERLAKELGLPLLGQIPLYPRVMEGGDRGAPIVEAEPESSAARALTQIATRVTERVGAAATG